MKYRMRLKSALLALTRHFILIIYIISDNNVLVFIVRTLNAPVDSDRYIINNDIIEDGIPI